jgi:hypothetical protein
MVVVEVHSPNVEYSDELISTQYAYQTTEVQDLGNGTLKVSLNTLTQSIRGIIKIHLIRRPQGQPTCISRLKGPYPK